MMTGIMERVRRGGQAAMVSACVALAVGLVAGSLSDDAEAGRRRQLKTLWAVVNQDGTVDSSKGLTVNERLSAGIYRMTFNRDVSGCAYAATADEGFLGMITVESGAGAQRPKAINIFTADSRIVSSDIPFHLIVHC